jgi:predicted nucleotidyltransferase
VLCEAIEETVKNYIHALEERALPVQFGVVFGSQVGGRGDEWSDIDLLVVSPKFDQTPDRRDIDLLWRVSARIDSRIEPIPCGVRQWETDVSSGVIETARRHGERVA